MFKRIVLYTEDGETIELAGYMIRDVTMTVDPSTVALDISLVIPKIRWPSYGYGRTPRGWRNDYPGAVQGFTSRPIYMEQDGVTLERKIVPTGLFNAPPQKAVPPSPVIDPSRLLKEKNEP
jgi:hypothetical protein